MRLRDGHLVVSVPNVANITVRLMLLFGKFDYTERGILDRTHVRFFTRKTARRFLEEGGWEIEKRIDEELPLVLADAQSLESVLKNLIGNALKYAAQGKWLSVSARAARNRKEVQITVADHGPGISQADLPHIFEPFYRGQEVFGSQNSGAGLGLSLVERHIQAHKGRVTVETSEESGTAVQPSCGDDG